MPIETLLGLLNREKTVTGEADLPDHFQSMGCEVEETTTIQQYLCGVCGKVIERTEAQGAALTCASCGTDFRERPESVSTLGENHVVRLDMLAVRPDLFDPGGMGRALRGFLGVQTGLAEYDLRPGKLRVQVDPALANDDSYRPFIGCAVLRKVRLDHDRIKMLMNLQEDLHWALGRNRKLASIGVYDLARLEGTNFRYDAVARDALTFVPLGFDAGDSSAACTPDEILARHKTGQAFAHLLEKHRKVPLLRDERGNVLSMPPIINAEACRVTHDSTDLFCDVTGVSQRSVDRALNIVVTSLRELIPELEIETVTIDGPDGARVTPDLTPAAMDLSVAEARDTLGAPLESGQLADLLERMGHRVQGRGAETLKVEVPAWRNDVMHPVDLIEDAGVAFGYDNLVPELVPTFTVGAARPIEERSAAARRVMVGHGFHQVMTLTLTSEPAAFGKWRIPADPRAVQIENPISSEQTMCRVSLLPGLLETLAINKQYDLPQQLFEVGDCCFCDDSETGAGERRFMAAALIGSQVGYADVRAVLDSYIYEMGIEATIAASDDPRFIPGRGAVLRDGAGETIGAMGEVHPEVLEAYGLKHPVACVEIALQ